MRHWKGGGGADYSSTIQSVELRTMVSDLRGIGLNSVTQHSVIKKAGRSSADEKHTLTREHESDRASSSMAAALVDDSVQHQTSRAQSDSDDEVSTACPSLKKDRKCVALQLQPSSTLDYIGTCDDLNVAIVGGYLMGATVGAVVGAVGGAVVGAGVGAVVGAGVGA
ncbi:hypothetical protein, partial [Anaplasma bovis]|uniref:hypothetical protein n=1 Tax=Anaplasma bovis TaxID=186733 RepID=UPI002FF12165